MGDGGSPLGQWPYVQQARQGGLPAPSARSRIVWVCAANCVISLASTCFYYEELHRLQDFPFFATQLNAILGVCICGAILAVALRWPAAAPAAAAPAAAPPPRLCRWAELALLLAVQNTLEIASIQRIGNDNLPPILQQAVVPITLGLSCAVLRSKYTRRQLLGALLVVGGVVAGFMPTLLLDGAAGPVDLFWVAVFLLSRIPQALANVLGEDSLRGRSHISWACKAALFTQLLGLPFNFCTALLLACFQTGGPSAALRDYRGGAACLVGRGGEGCAGALAAAMRFAVPGAMYTLSEFQVLQRTSATTYFLLAALQLPLQDVLLSLPVVMGSLRSTFHPSFAFSIAAVAVGLALYGSGAQALSAAATEQDARCAAGEAARCPMLWGA